MVDVTSSEPLHPSKVNLEPNHGDVSSDSSANIVSSESRISSASSESNLSVGVASISGDAYFYDPKRLSLVICF